jgi:hypothetical protein
MKKSLQDRYEIYQEKPMYKMKIFDGVESKVINKIKQDIECKKGGQTVRPMNPKNIGGGFRGGAPHFNYNRDNQYYVDENEGKNDTKYDNLIRKVENEIKEL